MGNPCAQLIATQAATTRVKWLKNHGPDRDMEGRYAVYVLGGIHAAKRWNQLSKMQRSVQAYILEQ